MSHIPYRLLAAGATHVGMKRSRNQDSFLVDLNLGLFIVADGMGGHLGGEVASKLAIESIASYLQTHSNDLKPASPFVSAIESANEVIQQKAINDPTLQGMGTTTTALYFCGETLYIGHVGDSRCYYIFSRDRIWQLTRDHSLVQEKVRAGLITHEQAKTDKMKNVITRSVGFEERVLVELYQMSYQAGDVFVVCCDGISNMLSNTEICATVTQALLKRGSVELAAQSLINVSNEKGADDNVTTIVIQVNGPKSE